MTKQRFKGFIPVIIFFILLNAFFLTGKHWLQRWGAAGDVLILGNALLFVLTFITFILTQKGLEHPNPNVFVRSVYGSIMIKLFVCMITAFIYIALNKKNLNKPALFTCMALYLVYTFMEVGVLMKMLKRRKNG